MGLIARGLEEQGISTICMSTRRDITEAVKPPRAAFLDSPIGHPIGKALEPDLQMSVIKDALNALESIKEPGGIVDLPYQWTNNDFSWQEHPFALWSSIDPNRRIEALPAVTGRDSKGHTIIEQIYHEF